MYIVKNHTIGGVALVYIVRRTKVDTVHFYTLAARCNPTCPVPSYRSSFVTFQGSRRLAVSLLGHRWMHQFSFEIPQGNNARLTQSFPLRDDVEEIWVQFIAPVIFSGTRALWG